jgi:hypothetical protein
LNPKKLDEKTFEEIKLNLNVYEKMLSQALYKAFQGQPNFKKEALVNFALGFLYDSMPRMIQAFLISKSSKGALLAF